MNVNFGLLPPMELPRDENGKRLKGKEKSLQALKDLIQPAKAKTAPTKRRKAAK